MQGDCDGLRRQACGQRDQVAPAAEQLEVPAHEGSAFCQRRELIAHHVHRCGFGAGVGDTHRVSGAGECLLALPLENIDPLGCQAVGDLARPGLPRVDGHLPRRRLLPRYGLAPDVPGVVLGEGVDRRIGTLGAELQIVHEKPVQAVETECPENRAGCVCHHLQIGLVRVDQSIAGAQYGAAGGQRGQADIGQPCAVEQVNEVPWPGTLARIVLHQPHRLCAQLELGRRPEPDVHRTSRFVGGICGRASGPYPELARHRGCG